jgi:phosphoribosyl 1,2-cyclic phosphate phosphodiesterase
VKLIMLGSGTSTGVPRIGNDWGACDPNEPRNRRSRVSIVVQSRQGARILVDTSTDLRSQLLAAGIEAVDAVVWTHDHADHCHGIDDLRPMRFERNSPLPGYASSSTVHQLRQRFSYVFAGQHGYPTIVHLQSLERVKIIAGFGLASCEMPHGPGKSTGFRFESDGKTVGYATDFGAISDEMIALFRDVDILVTDCLRRESHPTHASLEMAIDFGRRANAALTVLTHLDKSMDYAALSAETPDNVLVGYDGMQIDLG